MSKRYTGPTMRELRVHDLLAAVAAIVKAADRPVTVQEVCAELRRARPETRYHDVRHALFTLRRRGLIHGRQNWRWGSSPKAKRPVVIKRLDDAA